MAPIVPPQENTESYLFDETGVFLFTTQQRQSRRFSIVVEKVALGQRVDYYNFSTPEPKSFWGYIQIVRRDSIVKTIPLEYRRQILYSWDSYEIEPIEQLRCLVKDSTLLLFDNIATLLLAAGGDAEQIGQDRANYLLKNGQPRIVPTIPDTGFYYEIEPQMGARITLIWQDYLTPCENPAGKQFLQSPRATEKDESGPGGNDGGGTRPTDPPPSDRSSDPDSDNAAPPPGVPAVPTPEPPPPPPGNFRMLLTYRLFNANSSGACVAGLTQVSTYFLRNNSGPGSAGYRTTGEAGPGQRREIVGLDRDGNYIGTSVSQPVAPSSCYAEIVSVENIPIP